MENTYKVKEASESELNNIEKMLESEIDANKDLAEQIIEGDVERAYKILDNHPALKNFETKRDIMWLRDEDGDEVYVDNCNSFCEDCLPIAVKKLRIERRIEGIPMGKIEAHGMWSSGSESDDFETCEICGVYFQSCPLFSNGLDHYDNDVDWYFDNWEGYLHELRELMESWRSFKTEESILRWKIARKIQVAYSDGYPEFVEKMPEERACATFSNDFYKIGWETREQLMKSWGMDYEAMHKMGGGEYHKVTPRMCIEISKFSGKNPSEYYRKQLEQTRATKIVKVA